MSRILRRPMFRGGKVVSSYGNGIASGLTNKPKRGLVDEPGGYAGIVTLQDILAQTGAPMTGQQILDYAGSKQMDLGPNFKINKYSKFIPEEVDVTVGEDTMSKPFSEVLMSEGFQKYEDPNEILGGKDKQGEIGDVDLGEGRKFSSNFGDTDKIKKIIDNSKEKEVSFSSTSDGDISTVDESDLDSLIEKYYEKLGGKEVKKRYTEDVLSSISKSMEEGRGFKGAITDAAKVKSDEKEYRKAAGMLGIKGEQAQKLYETKLKNQSGQLQKAVEYIKAINPGMNNKEALATYQRRPASLSETVGKYKKQDGVIMPSGITLAAGEWFSDDYKGELPTDGNIKRGDKAVGKDDGAYTDKSKGLIFVIEKEVVTNVSKFEN